ncbi:MAG: DMT family transporter [Kineosporiaceae bacterium]
MVDPGGHAGTRSGLRKGIALASCCLCLLGVMPIIVNARPDTSAAVTFAFWLSFWQFLFGLPLQIREWRSGERGVLARGPDAGGNRRTVMITLVTGGLFALSTWGYVLAFQKVGTVNAAIALQVYPLFAAGLEAILLRRGRTLSELGFIILIVIAVYDLATQGTWRMSGMSAWFAVAVAVPLLWSVAHVILREVLVTCCSCCHWPSSSTARPSSCKPPSTFLANRSPSSWGWPTTVNSSCGSTPSATSMYPSPAPSRSPHRQ